MRRLQNFLARANRWLLVVAVWAVLCRPAWACPDPDPPPDTSSGGGPFVLGYFMAFLLIALGLFVVCRPSSRSSWSGKRIAQEEKT